MFLTSNSFVQLKQKSSIHNTAFVSSESEEKYAQIKLRLQVKTVQNCSKQILMWENNRGLTFSTGGSIMYSYFVQKWRFKVKMP